MGEVMVYGWLGTGHPLALGAERVAFLCSGFGSLQHTIYGRTRMQ